MSNEDLVAAIQAGEDRMEELWNQVRGFVANRARRVMAALDGRADVELDDLIQSGYLALVEAVSSYKPGEAMFLTHLGYRLKTAFAEATRFRSRREQRETMTTLLSLDAPIGNEDNTLVLGDCIQEPEGASQLEEIETRIWHDQLQKAIADALQILPEDQRELLRLRFWEGYTLKELSQCLGVSVENIRQRECKAIRALRKPGIAHKLRPYYEFDFYRGTGLGAFRNSGMSVQEWYVILGDVHQRQKSF